MHNSVSGTGVGASALGGQQGCDFTITGQSPDWHIRTAGKSKRLDSRTINPVESLNERQYLAEFA